LKTGFSKVGFCMNPNWYEATYLSEELRIFSFTAFNTEYEIRSFSETMLGYQSESYMASYHTKPKSLK
jgi:hypothetical protein